MNEQMNSEAIILYNKKEILNVSLVHIKERKQYHNLPFSINFL